MVEDGAAGDACAFCECFCVEGAVAALKDEGFCCLNDCNAVLCLAGGTLVRDVCGGFNKISHAFYNTRNVSLRVTIWGLDSPYICTRGNKLEVKI